MKSGVHVSTARLVGTNIIPSGVFRGSFKMLSLVAFAAIAKVVLLIINKIKFSLLDFKLKTFNLKLLKLNFIRILSAALHFLKTPLKANNEHTLLPDWFPISEQKSDHRDGDQKLIFSNNKFNYVIHRPQSFGLLGIAWSAIRAVPTQCLFSNKMCQIGVNV
jgi:hypothetical protein